MSNKDLNYIANDEWTILNLSIMCLIIMPNDDKAYYEEYNDDGVDEDSVVCHYDDDYLMMSR